MSLPIQLLNAHFDGKVLTEEEARTLSAWVGADPANARTLVELGIIHSQVDYWLSVPRFLDELGDSEDPAVQRSIEAALETIELDSYQKQATLGVAAGTGTNRNNRAVWGWVTAAVAASLLVAVVSQQRPVRQQSVTIVAAPVAPSETPSIEPAPVLATLTEAIGVEPRGADRLRRGRHFKRGETLVVDEGVLAMTTSDGSEIVVEGPATLVFEEVQRITLKSGRLAARIDSESTGLVVQTPTAKVVDLGTEFGVAVGHNLETDVAVYDGAVELYGVPQGGDAEVMPSKRITAGRAGHVDSQGSLNWVVQTLANDREFIRPDEIASLRKARSGSAEASQQTGFYALQRTRGLMAFQSFDVPSEGGSYSVAFNDAAPRSATTLAFGGDLRHEHLYTSGALLLGSGDHAFLDVNTSSDSPLARANLLTNRGHIGRSGAELWIAWKSKTINPDRAGDHAGLSLMFGDQRLMQEPLFVGHAGGRRLLAIVSNEGSRSTELELDANPDTFAVDPLELDDQTHQWVVQLIFGERGDKIAVWCDVPLEAIRETRPQAETVNANLMFDRLRLGVSNDADEWLFDDVVMATTIDAITEVHNILSTSASRR